MIIIATLFYRLVLRTRYARLKLWYIRFLAHRGLTGTYTLDRGWILYRIPQEMEVK